MKIGVMTDCLETTVRIQSIQQHDICIKDLQTGLTAFIQRERHRYSDDKWEKITQLREGDVVTVVLEPQNALNTIWEFKTIGDRKS